MVPTSPSSESFFFFLRKYFSATVTLICMYRCFILQITKNIEGVTKALDKAMSSMDLTKVIVFSTYVWFHFNNKRTFIRALDKREYLVIIGDTFC